jgi:hypothetical protein
VGSGKTALTLALCKALRDKYQIAVVTNDIYTEEDAQFLVRNEALAPERIIGVETGGCPHTAIREDASINLEAVGAHRALPGSRRGVRRVGRRQPRRDLQSELSDLTLFRDRRRRGRQDSRARAGRDHQVGPAGDQHDRPRADGWGASLEVMERGREEDARRAAVRVHQPEDGPRLGAA